MKIFRHFLIYSTLFLLIGCSATTSETSSNKYSFSLKMKKLLGNNLEVVNSINIPEVQISYFELPKNSNKIEEIIKLLKNDGWKLKGQGVGVDTYCLGTENFINIVTATSRPAIDFQGGELKRTDFSVDSVLYSYTRSGEDICQ